MNGRAFGRCFGSSRFRSAASQPGLVCVSRLRFGFRVLWGFQNFRGPPTPLPPASLRRFFLKFKGVVFVGLPSGR